MSKPQVSQHQLNEQQYQGKSEAYLKSKVHAQGLEFGKMQALVQQHQYQEILDLGCGGGHVSYHLAPYAKAITAYDLSAEMVDLVVQQAQQKGFANVTGQVGVAENLSFAAQRFDLVVSRYSAHHWQNLPQALAEIHRVLRDHGRVVIFDIVGSSHPILDTFIQSIEFIRDPSHVRDYSLAEWIQMTEQAGFHAQQIERQSLTLDFQSWVQRMQSPADAVATILNLQNKVSDLVRDYYKVQKDGTFVSQAVYLELTKI
ncbi:class I SAM-dependent methyltransferase [Acinetobacter larvae]|uniref:SAM-dependent methyltransferase n=1 Tax=Acinetobacter larvae TaxID=1789224 RepID=A0A1B2LWS9_9GAMM|nr:class I SAM-dependent methyltransferase [Acinetobacter larvae]AOA57396.1 SAM-dependent methyltransferase [Acinetobacter larvae]